jgi:hypothetical protein
VTVEGMKNLRGVIGVFAVCLVSLACGSSSGGNNVVGGPSCTVGACGGDIVGSWTATEVCVDKSVLMQAFVSGLMGRCSGANLGSVTYTPSGSLVFNADMTYATTLGITGSLVVNVPGSCFQNGATCAGLAAAFDGDPTIQSATCSGSSACACTLVTAPTQMSESGTYTLSGSTLLTTPTGATAADSQDYCVKGTTATFPDTAMSRMTSGLVALVAQKQ